MDIHALETKIHHMVDDLQGLCSTVGLSNTANEEVVVTSVFLYKFLNDKFMFNMEKFAEEIDVPVESILNNDDDMLEAFYQYNSKDVAFAYEDTIQYLINRIEQPDFYKQFDDALVRISNYDRNDAFAVETAEGEKTALFEPLTDKVEGKPGANYWSWRARHRGWSHWPVIDIAILAIMQMGLLPQGADVERGATFICIGALLHIVEDAFCGKVPLFLPWQKVGIKLFTVGSVTEYLFSMAVVILTYIIHAQVMVK